MSNKGSLAVTHLLDNVPGIDKLITDKKVIPESKNGWGGLEFILTSKGKKFKHKIFLNFNDLYDITTRSKTLTNVYVGEVHALLSWVVKLENNNEEE